jgi:hypothetical protein
VGYPLRLATRHAFLGLFNFVAAMSARAHFH